jgi:hypothetical protein
MSNVYPTLLRLLAGMDRNMTEGKVILNTAVIPQMD